MTVQEKVLFGPEPMIDLHGEPVMIIGNLGLPVSDTADLATQRGPLVQSTLMRIGTAIAALALCACTETALELLPPAEPAVLDNKLTITGEVCTEKPEDLVFPLRVVFLVDASESMEVNDPPDPVTGETGRERAVRETVESLLADGATDVKVSVVRFSAETQALTPVMAPTGEFLSYFTDDLDQVLVSLSRLAETDRTTNFINALSEAYAEIRHEVMNASQESLALSTYHVIMITDGIPDVEGTGSQREAILEGVTALLELGRLFHVGTISVNTALIATGNPAVDTFAEELLGAMAEAGRGTFRSFVSGGELNFLYIDLSALRRVFTLRTLVAHNINAVVVEDVVLADSDGDGVADEVELAIDSSPFDPDTDGDGCRDGLEYSLARSGMDPIDPGDCQCYLADYCFDADSDHLCDCSTDVAEGSCCTDADSDGLCDCIDEDGDGRCDPSNYVDTDGDGLFDCEERYTGSNRAGPDSDGDGLVDFLEVRFGTAPDQDDTADDFDWDAVPNGEEVKTGSDPRHDSSRGRGDIAYRYKVQTGDVREGSACFTFEVANITLTDPYTTDGATEVVGPAGQGYSGSNRVFIYAGEVPFDDVESYARFRVACVEASFRRDGNYKDPPSGAMEILETDFVELPDFDPALHCVQPGAR